MWTERFAASLSNKIHASKFTTSGMGSALEDPRYYGMVYKMQVLLSCGGGRRPFPRPLWLSQAGPSGYQVYGRKDDPLMQLCIDVDRAKRQMVKPGLGEPSGIGKRIGTSHNQMPQGDDGMSRMQGRIGS